MQISKTLLCPLPVSLRSPFDATFTQTFPEEKEEGATFGEKTTDAVLSVELSAHHEILTKQDHDLY